MPHTDIEEQAIRRAYKDAEERDRHPSSVPKPSP